MQKQHIKLAETDRLELEGLLSKISLTVKFISPSISTITIR